RAAGRRRSLWWEAALLSERALVLTPRNDFALGYATRYTRDLNLDWTGITTSAFAYQANPLNTLVLSERAATLASAALGDALDAVEEPVAAEQEPNDWLRAVHAYVLTLRAEYGRAVEQLATLTCVPDVDPWIIVTRGRARLLEGDRDGANEDFACVLASTEPGQPMAI